MSDRFDITLERKLETKPGSDGDDGGHVRRLELITGTGRRRRWSSDDKARIVVASFAPGATVSDVARRHGLSPQQLFAWRREARAMFAGTAEVAAAPAVTRLREKPGRSRTDEQVPAFAPVVLAAPVGSPPSIPPKRNAPGIIEIAIGDVTVRVIGQVASEAIEAALRAVRRVS